jgi:hypothetical protein
MVLNRFAFWPSSMTTTYMGDQFENVGYVIRTFEKVGESGWLMQKAHRWVSKRYRKDQDSYTLDSMNRFTICGSKCDPEFD